MTPHFQVRAFAGWPGTRARVQVVDASNARVNILDLKIITTKVSSNSSVENAEADYVAFRNGALIFTCGGGTALEVRFLIFKLLQVVINCPHRAFCKRCMLRIFPRLDN